MSLSVSLGGCFVCFRWKVIHFRIWQSISFGEANNFISLLRFALHTYSTQLWEIRVFFSTSHFDSPPSRCEFNTFSLLLHTIVWKPFIWYWEHTFCIWFLTLTLSLSLFEAFASKHEPPDLTHLVLKLFYQTVSTTVTKILVSLDDEYIWPKQKVKTTF